MNDQSANRFPKICGLAAALLGAVVLVGWVLHWELVKTLFPGLPSMKPNTALCFILCGSSLFRLARQAQGSGVARDWWSPAGMSAVIGIALVDLLEAFFGWHTGLDEWGFSDLTIQLSGHPGMMAPATAAYFLLAGAALFLQALFPGRRAWLPQSLAMLSLVDAALALLGYLFGNDPSYGLAPYSSMAVPTAVGATLLALGTLAVPPPSPWLGWIHGPGFGSVTARKLLPAALALSILCGWASFQAGQHGWLKWNVDSIAYTLSNLVVCLVLIAWLARNLNRLESERQKREDQVAKLNATLEQRVAQRTAELDQANARLLGEIERHRQTGQALRLSEERLGLAVRGTSEGLWDWNIITGEDWFSDQWLRLLGFAPGELPYILDTWTSRIHPDDSADAQAKLLDHLEKRIPYDAELRVRCKDGSYRWFHTRGEAVRDLEGKAIRMAGAIADVHERKLAKEANARLAALVEWSEEAIIGTTMAGIVTSWNRGAQKLFGHSPEEMTGQPVALLFPPDRLDEESEILQKIARGDALDHFETVRRRKDGSLVDVSITISPIRDTAGIIIGASIFALDISERKRSDRLLAAQKAILEQIAGESHLSIIVDALLTMAGIGQEEPWMAIVVNDGSALELTWQTTPSLAPHLKLLLPRAPSSLAAASAFLQTPAGLEAAPDWKELCQAASNCGITLIESQSLIGGEGILRGMLLTFRKQPPSRKETQAADIAARLAAVAIERHEYLRTLRQSYHILESRVKERTAELESEIERRRKIEEDLRVSIKEAADLQLALDEHAVVAITDPQGIILYANDKFCSISKYSRAELIGQDHRLINSGVHSKDFFRTLWTTISEGRVWKGLICNRAKDGAFYWVDTTIVPFLDAAGNPVRYIAVRTDVTERENAIQALRISEERFRGAITYSAIGFALVGLDGHWLQVNSALCGIVGYTEMELFQSTFQQITHPDDLGTDLGHVTDLIAGRITHYHMEKRYIRKNGSIVWVLLSVSLVRDAEGTPLHFVSQVRDISESKHSFEELQKALEEARRSNKELEQFAYVASHDLQEPLRAVAGCVQILARRYSSKIDAQADELIRHAVDGSRRMQDLINDLLALSRIGSHGGALRETDSNVAINITVGNLNAAILESGAQVTAGKLPIVMADPIQLVQLLQNLIGNAIKYRSKEAPKIRIAARRENRHWLFSVSDNGIGIESRYFERIFGVFQRLHTRTEYPGTGIGLAICKKIAERHGGKIWVESSPGCGTTFYFTLLPPPHEN